MKSQDQNTKYLSKAELCEKLKQIKESHVSASQAIFVVKKLLVSVLEKEIVIEEIPNILVCTSHEFLELAPIFKEIISDNPLCVSKLLPVLIAFDLDSRAKQIAHELAMMILNQIDNEKIPELIPFILFTVSKSSVTSLFAQLKDILVVHESLKIFKSFETGVRPHLSAFFRCVSSSEKWTFLDFFVVLISQNRPSLRSHIPTLVWSSIISNNLTFQSLEEFCEHTQILESHFNLVTSFFDILITTIPKCYETSSIGVISSLAIKIIYCFPDNAANFIDDLISYVLNGSYFLSNISSHCLLSVSPKHFKKHISDLDDCLSQSGILSTTAINTLCNLIAVGTPQAQQPVLMISLQKKLFHSSYVLVEAGVSLALSFSNFMNFNEILKWILKAIRVNRLVEASLKPSALLSVIDLIWKRTDDLLSVQISDFCCDILKTFSVITTLKEKDSSIGAERHLYAIASKLIPSEQHAELCGEAIFLMSTLLNNEDNEVEKGKINSKPEIEYLKEISNLCFQVPSEFISSIAETPTNSDNASLNTKKLKHIHVQNVLHIRSLIIPLIYRSPPESDNIFFFMDIINSIDDFFASEKVIKMRNVYDPFECTYFPIPFIFSLLSNVFFEFPNDLNLLYFILKSLYSIFVDNISHRFSIYDKISFLLTNIPQQFPLRVVTLLSRLVQLSVAWRKENKIPLVKRCVRAVSYGLDFITYLITCGVDTGLVYADNIIDLLEHNEDVGISCRLILLGLFMGIKTTDLSNLVAQCFDGQRLTSDLCESRIIYPFGFISLADIVKPFNDGANWRLLVFLSLQFEEFEPFEAQFLRLLENIKDDRMEIQMCFPLVDILTSKMCASFSDNFIGISELCYELVRILTICDIFILRSVFKLLHSLSEFKKALKCNCPISHQINAFLNNQFHSFDNIQDKINIKKTIAQIQGECEMLTEGTTFENDDENNNVISTRNDNEQEIQQNPFELNEKSDDDFTISSSSDNDNIISDSS